VLGCTRHGSDAAACPFQENVTSYIKPEEHNVLQCRQRKLRLSYGHPQHAQNIWRSSETWYVRYAYTDVSPVLEDDEWINEEVQKTRNTRYWEFATLYSRTLHSSLTPLLDRSQPRPVPGLTLGWGRVLPRDPWSHRILPPYRRTDRQTVTVITILSTPTDGAQ